MSDVEEEGCPHGLDARWCSVCLHGVSRPDVVTVERTFEARYPGTCSDCSYPFAVGARIILLSNGRYVHEGCE